MVTGHGGCEVLQTYVKVTKELFEKEKKKGRRKRGNIPPYTCTVSQSVHESELYIGTHLAEKENLCYVCP